MSQNISIATSSEPSGSALTYYAYAKINLGLEILSKRSDGFHEIATIMQAIELHDVLTFSPSDDLILNSTEAEIETSDNLVLRAARQLQATARTKQGASIYLEKRIPLASGLGGGSSDAACTLLALCTLWKLNLPLGELIEIAAGLGSDVPYFFYGGTALARGRGEIITPLPPISPTWVLLVCPRVQIPNKTRLLYSEVTPAQYSDGSATARLAGELRERHEPTVEALTNIFQPMLLHQNAAVRASYERLRRAGARHILLSGAGPSLFTLVGDEDEARKMKEGLGELDADVFLTRTINRGIKRTL